MNDQHTTTAIASTGTAPRSRLFRKYVLFIVALVASVLIASGALELYFSYQENRAALAQLQQEKALTAAVRIEQFIQAIVGQLGWTTHPQPPGTQSALEQRRIEFYRLQRQAPAITDLSYLDSAGNQQLRVSRLAIDAAGGGQNTHVDATEAFASARNAGIYYGPVYFRKDSEPYMTIALPAADGGVTVAEVNLKFTWDVVSAIKTGKAGLAYVIGPTGNLIAHPDLLMVLQQTDFSQLAQVKAALAATTQDAPGSVGDTTLVADDPGGRRVLSSYAAVTPPGWFVFVEQPLSEAWVTLYASALRGGVLMLVGLLLALLVSLLLARRMVTPIRALQAGAAHIGAGDLSSRIDVHSGDELEMLAESFNLMAARLEESYAGLERKIEERTRELARSVEELQALSEISRAVNSTLDLEQMLATIVARAVQLSDADGGAVYEYDDTLRILHAAHQLDEELIRALQANPMRFGEGLLGRAVMAREPLQLSNLGDAAAYGDLYPQEIRSAMLRSGVRTLLALPLLREQQTVGGLVVGRKRTEQFTAAEIELLQAFATQSALAIHNAQLFRELADQGRQLEQASRHKSQFLANMSHELRTPLNAILGYTELIADGIYGELPEKVHEVLERVSHNGRHLLGLINAVLDLSKIEAGQLTLALGDYTMKDLVYSTVTAVESLAAEKRLALKVELSRDLPPGRGDRQRLGQVLLNLIGNAIKFTDQGEVKITVNATAELFEVAVSDTGPGIAPADQARIFDEFQQVDDSSTRTKGGSGLGLAIARKIINLHGGEIGVESKVGAGSKFWFRLPVQVERQQEAA